MSNWLRFIGAGGHLRSQMLKEGDAFEEQANSRLRSQVDATKPRKPSMREEINELRAKQDESQLFLAAIIRSLLSKGIVTEADILQAAREADLADGVEDGKTDHIL